MFLLAVAVARRPGAAGCWIEEQKAVPPENGFDLTGVSPETGKDYEPDHPHPVG